MLNEEEILILDKKNKDITANVINYSSSKIEVKFGDKSYSYKSTNIKIISNTKIISNDIIRSIS